MAYIYQIINDVNQKIYIGKTENSIEKRFKEKNIDIKSSIEWMRENRGKKVGQYDLNDNFIQSFDSRGLASKYLIDNHYTTSVAIDAVAGRIGQVCNGKRKTAYGFKWKSL